LSLLSKQHGVKTTKTAECEHRNDNCGVYLSREEEGIYEQAC